MNYIIKKLFKSLKINKQYPFGEMTRVISDEEFDHNHTLISDYYGYCSGDKFKYGSKVFDSNRFDSKECDSNENNG